MIKKSCFYRAELPRGYNKTVPQQIKYATIYQQHDIISHCSVQEDDVIPRSLQNVWTVATWQTQKHWDLLGRQRVDVPDLPGHGHCVAVDDVEMLLSKEKQTLTGVQTLDPGTAVHVLDLKRLAEQRGCMNGEKGSVVCLWDKKVTLSCQA